jgi:hypothetical protein
MTTPTLAATGHWTAGGDLPAAATWYGQHDGAVRLQNGKVLTAGGADGASAALTRTALFDPAAGTWAAAAPLSAARRLHTATPLEDGRVLVAGGTSGSSPLSPGLSTAEVYDPADGTWESVASMGEPRWGHSAVLLADHTVLVSGGTTTRSGDSVRALRTAEVYDPEADEWRAADPMTDARTGHATVRLAGGKVLACGGSAPISGRDEAALAFCELYDAGTGHWAPTGSLLVPRSQHQALLASGTTVLVVGGSTPGTPGDGTFDPFSTLTAELFDLATGAWTAMPQRPGGRGLHRAVSLGSGKVLVIGGTGGGRDRAGYQSALIFDTAARTWSAAAGLTTGRWAFAATALADGRVLVAGGATGSGLAAADPAVDDLTRHTEIFSTSSGGPA